MKNNRQANHQANRLKSQPAHRPENNLIKRYLDRITRNNNSIILREQSKWKPTYKNHQANPLKHYLDCINLPIKIVQLCMQSK